MCLWVKQFAIVTIKVALRLEPTRIEERVVRFSEEKILILCFIYTLKVSYYFINNVQLRYKFKGK